MLRLEADALAAYAEGLDASFAEAVALMFAARGRVIVSGMGKSGHVARKIAATLASTGTPAQFVHPAEASHGDLGMITRDDVALVLSNSGETRELADIIAHTRRFSIPLIGIAGRPGSTLLSAADVALVLPKAPEACPNGLAPTTSTTMSIAIGDALAVALMERRVFTREHYALLHPGGSLGARLLKVADLMHRGAELPLVAEETSMREALVEMTAKSFGITGVTDAQGRLTGVITDGDLRRNMEGLLERRAGEVATRNPRVIGADALASEALALMNGARPTLCLFVLSPGAAVPARPVGLVHVHDCLRAGVDAGTEGGAPPGGGRGGGGAA
ncbi:KpsF/GutQ family sugar-phosphate isomerase [Paralimibaculum aggregatum]|uniref:KpsF/GutQ family sugar-phosphate isomerase n=1 Tax=Paralimibaculum aggregatum TaxID=3036245 RepID=UPI003D9FCB10